MPQKKQAEELISQYSKITGYSIQSLNGWILREMAIITVNKFLERLPKQRVFWEGVKREIELM